MRYIVIPPDKAKAAGLDPRWHNSTQDGRMIATEKEVMAIPVEGTLEDRAKALGGEIKEIEEILKLIK